MADGDVPQVQDEVTPSGAEERVSVHRVVFHARGWQMVHPATCARQRRSVVDCETNEAIRQLPFLEMLQYTAGLTYGCAIDDDGMPQLWELKEPTC